MEKLVRTLQVNFPYLLDAKFGFKSLVSRALRRPQESDFRALSLFPDIDGAIYLDVGANRGQSIEAILMLTRNSLVVSFEPNPLLCEKLERKFGNNTRVVVNAFGLGHRQGEYSLYIPYYKSWMYDGLASFKRESASGWLRDQVYGYQERHLTVREIKCRVKRLDDLGLAPFLIKLDIQGYEFEALAGGEETLTKYEPVLLIESPDRETTQYLKGLGYRFYRFEEGRLMPDVMGLRNTYFMTDTKAALVRPLRSMPDGESLG